MFRSVFVQTFTKMVLQGKNAIVIGGCGGIGLAICEKFLAEGIENLAVIDTLEREEAVKRFSSPKVLYKKSRVDNKSQLKMTLEEISKSFKYIDILINSAGVSRENDAEFVIGVNFTGVVNSTMIGFDLMRKNGVGRGGFIINIASIAGLRPVISIPVYAGTKHAVVGFTRSLSAEILHKETEINFISICPGLTETSFLPTLTSPSEIEPFINSTEEVTKDLPFQKPSAVADCIFKVISEGENGDVWSVDGGKIENVSMQFPIIQ